MKQDRLLVIILAGIGVLVVATLVLFFARRGNQDFVPDDTPDGVVRNYILALHQGDYDKAYAYLGTPDFKPTLAEFKSDMIALKPQFAQIFVRFAEVDQTDGVAAVSLVLNHPGSGPFENGWDESTRVQLTKDSSGAWKITTVPYPFWDPGWTIIKPIAP